MQRALAKSVATDCLADLRQQSDGGPGLNIHARAGRITMKKLLALSGLALAASSNVLAVEQPYIGAAFAQPTFSDNLSGDATPSLAQLRFGSDLPDTVNLTGMIPYEDGCRWLISAKS